MGIGGYGKNVNSVPSADLADSTKVVFYSCKKGNFVYLTNPLIKQLISPDIFIIRKSMGDREFGGKKHVREFFD